MTVATATVIHRHTHARAHLPVENDAPDEPENQFVIPINNVRRSDVHQFHLQGEQTDGHISQWASLSETPTSSQTSSDTEFPHLLGFQSQLVDGIIEFFGLRHMKRSTSHLIVAGAEV